MGNTLYLECNTGISGDMFTAALLDLGADREGLLKVLNSLPVHGFDIHISRVKKSGLDACDFDVVLDHAHENHDHDMDYLYGHLHAHEHHHEHEHAHDHHDHEHAHDHGHHHHHEHRGLKEIREIISAADMNAGAKAIAERIFEIIAEAEAKAHGETIETVHFHEVGAVDSIVDVIAAAYCMDDLGITDVIIPYLCEGQGTVRCQHGILPVPVPAVANVIAAHGLIIKQTGRQGELVTPTGAAIAAAIQTGTELPEKYTVRGIGLGAGKREYEIPSILRASLIEEADAQSDGIWRLETNVDDSTGEQMGFVMEKLFAAGARDVHYMPVYMKKNRPAYELVVICSEKDIPALELIMFKETTTIGIRRQKMERSILPRKIVTVETAHGSALAKQVTLPDGEVRFYPEFESVRELTAKTGLPYEKIVQAIRDAAYGTH